jgi:hypothetical protein
MKKLIKKIFGKKIKPQPKSTGSKHIYTRPSETRRSQELYHLIRLALTCQWDRLAGILELSTDKVRDLISLPPLGSCSHLKGKGPYKNPTEEFNTWSWSRKDYDVYMHTFIDRSQRIHCRRCGQNWFRGQPGWEAAVAMTQSSTNRPSASERPNTPVSTSVIPLNSIIVLHQDSISKEKL